MILLAADALYLAVCIAFTVWSIVNERALESALWGMSTGIMVGAIAIALLRQHYRRAQRRPGYITDQWRNQ